MLSLHTNTASLSAQNAVGSTNKTLSTSLTRLSTGFRVNSAMDDAAGLQIATRLNAQTRGMAVAQRNTQNGISMMQTAEGAFNEITNMLLRMKDLATEAFTASTATADKTALQSEYDQLGAELASMVKNTSFAGEKLFSDGATIAGASGKLATAMVFQIGATSTETLSLNLGSQLGALAGASGLGAVSTHYAAAAPGAAGTELSATANTIITTINTTIDNIGAMRASLGAAANRLDHVYNNLSNMSINTQAAKGRIMDVDYAAESASMTTKQMLLQAGTAMLKQSNSMSQLALSLLQ